MSKAKKTLASLTSLLLLWLGLVDVPEQVDKWRTGILATWTAMSPYLSSEFARWMFVLLGMALLLWAWWPRRLSATGQQTLALSSQQPEQPSEESKDDPIPAARIIVDVTPEYLSGLYENHTDIQADKLAAAFIGKWLRVSGPLGNHVEQ